LPVRIADLGGHWFVFSSKGALFKVVLLQFQINLSGEPTIWGAGFADHAGNENREDRTEPNSNNNPAGERTHVGLLLAYALSTLSCAPHAVRYDSAR
jgi:hypothetical protein